MINNKTYQMYFVTKGGSKFKKNCVCQIISTMWIKMKIQDLSLRMILNNDFLFFELQKIK